MNPPDIDLFGDPITEPLPPPPGSDKRKPTVPRGYAAPPGSGPAGETCRTCAHYARIKYAKTYLKCARMKAVWTGGPGTDIKAGSPACRLWEK